MTELLHAWAIAPAAIGACCVAADRGRARWPDAVASALMLIAMLDTAITGLVAPVYWAAVLLGSAMALAAWQRPRRGAGGRAASAPGPMAVHTALGLVAMAALQVGMTPPSAATTAAAAHAHGGAGGGALLAALLLGGAVAYAALSALLVLRAHRPLDRAQLICMGISVLLMAVGVSM
ncbi:hypothetical protein JNB63_16900 [Microbacterium trichothecenolyticum]|uniref:hypothetical protein n=1 Tax=Microbacterium trichothecenolyticum TaxID=69370 RepID=UPI001C6E7F96|nr:hypothetical protein [Microbacterium trichothecenolyticum]MBW9121779.1 hypothetical protein [Microbacterium trichothecenolyticum]